MRNNPNGTWAEYQGAFGRGLGHGAVVAAMFTGGHYIPGVPLRGMASRVLRRQQKMFGTKAWADKTEEIISRAGYGALVLGYPDYTIPAMTSGAVWMSVGGRGERAQRFHDNRWERQQYARAAAPRQRKTTVTVEDGAGGTKKVDLLDMSPATHKEVVVEPFAREFLMSTKSGFNLSKVEMDIVAEPSAEGFGKKAAEFTRTKLDLERLKSARREYKKHLDNPEHNADLRNAWLVTNKGVTSTVNYDKNGEGRVELLTEAVDGVVTKKMSRTAGTGEKPPPDERIGIPLKGVEIAGEMVGREAAATDQPAPEQPLAAKGRRPATGREKWEREHPGESYDEAMKIPDSTPIPKPLILAGTKYEVAQTTDGRLVVDFIMPKGEKGEGKRHVGFLEEVKGETPTIQYKAEGVSTQEIRRLRAETSPAKRESGEADPEAVAERKRLHKKADPVSQTTYKVIGVEEVIQGKAPEWYTKNGVTDHAWHIEYYDGLANNYVVRWDKGKGFVGSRLKHYVENENRRTAFMDQEHRDKAMYGAMEKVLKKKLDTPEKKKQALQDLTREDFYRIQHKLTHWGLKPKDVVNAHKFKVNKETGEIDPDSSPGVRPIERWEADANTALVERHRVGVGGFLQTLKDAVENPIYTMEKMGDNFKYLFWHPMVEAEGLSAQRQEEWTSEHRMARNYFDKSVVDEAHRTYDEWRKLPPGEKKARRDAGTKPPRKPGIKTNWKIRRDAYERIGLHLLVGDPSGAATHREMYSPRDQIFVRERIGVDKDGKEVWSEPKENPDGSFAIKPEFLLTPQEAALTDWYKGQFSKLTTILNETRVSVGKEPLDGITGYYPLFRLLNSVRDGWHILERESQIDIQEEAKIADEVHRAFQRRLEEKQERGQARKDKMMGKFQQTLGITKHPGSSPTIQVLHHQKHRTGSTIPVVVDVRKTYATLANNIVRFGETEPVLHGLRQLLDYIPQDGRSTLEVAPNSYRTLDTWLRYNSGEALGESNDPLMKAVNIVARRMSINMHYSQLSWNVRTALIQTSAFRGPWLFAGKKNALKAAVASRAELDRAFRESKVIRTRMRGGLDIQESIDATGIRGLIQPTSVLGKAVRGGARAQIKMGDVGFKPLEWFDMQTTSRQWLAFEYQAKGWGWDAKKSRMYADEWTAKTAGTTTRSNRSPLQRSEVGRFLTMFQNFNIADFNMLVNEVMKTRGVRGGQEGRPGAKQLSKLDAYTKTLDYLFATALVNTFFEDFLPAVIPRQATLGIFGGSGRINSPFPTIVRALMGVSSLLPLPNIWDKKERDEFMAGPVDWWGKEYKARWAAVEEAWSGDGWKAHIADAAKEMVEILPGPGAGAKYETSPFGAGVEVTSNIFVDTMKGEFSEAAHGLAKGVLGVPAFSQAAKTRRGLEEAVPEAFGRSKETKLPPKIARRLKALSAKRGWSKEETEKQTVLWEMIYFLDDTLYGRTRPRH